MNFKQLKILIFKNHWYWPNQFWAALLLPHSRRLLYCLAQYLQQCQWAFKFVRLAGSHHVVRRDRERWEVVLWSGHNHELVIRWSVRSVLQLHGSVWRVLGWVKRFLYSCDKDFFFFGSNLSFLPRSILPGASSGVDVFFTFSGYLITALLIDEVSRTHAWYLGLWANASTGSYHHLMVLICTPLALLVRKWFYYRYWTSSTSVIGL